MDKSNSFLIYRGDGNNYVRIPNGHFFISTHAKGQIAKFYSASTRENLEARFRRVLASGNEAFTEGYLFSPPDERGCCDNLGPIS